MGRSRFGISSAALLLCTALWPQSAHALPDWLNPFGRVEAGVAFPLRSPQSDFFGAGFGGRLNLGTDFGDWIGVQLTAQMAALPPREMAPNQDWAVPIGVGGGIRLHLPYRYVVSPWIDADALYVRTGPLDKLGFTVGVGVHVPLGEKRTFRLGPFVRYFQIIDGDDQPNIDSTDASMLIVGASLEVGRPVRNRSDRDGDGVLDADDRCPELAGPSSTRGCPDRDSDGIADRDDRCPDVAGPVENQGCPIHGDADGDGVSDSKDKCPSVPGSAANQGCPLDTDGDGITDEKDKCPSEKGPALTNGCPDKDADGVADKEDKCPDEPGTPEYHGCPPPKVQVTEKKLEINQMIYFEFGKARIEERSYPILDELVKVLAENPGIKIQIEGHTDNVRSATFDNNTLSRKRAEAVKGYMVSHGVDTERLKTKGFGDKKPIAPNDTEEGRDKNRRVEFVITKGK